MKYKDNEAFKDKLKNQTMEKYRTNESLRNKVKMAGEKSYDTKAKVKHAKKKMLKSKDKAQNQSYKVKITLK